MPKPSLYARRRRTFTAILRVVSAVAAGAAVGAQPVDPAPCATCIVLIASPGQLGLLSEPLHGVEVLVRPDSAPAGGTGRSDDSSLVSAFGTIRSHGGRPGLLLAAADAIPSADALAIVSRVAIDVMNLAVNEDTAFRLKTRLTEIRGAKAGVVLGILGTSSTLDALLQRAIVSYLDYIGRAGGMPPPYPARPTATTPASASEAQISSWMEEGASPRWFVELPRDPDAAKPLLTDVARAARLLKEGLIAGGAVEVRCANARAATYLDPESLDTIALAQGCGPGQVVVTPPSPEVERVALSNGDVLVRVPSAGGRFAEGVQVVGARALTVGEIVARHQAAAARQRRLVRRLISTGTMALTFEAPGFPAPMTIASETVIFTEPGRTEIEQRNIRVNGVQFRGEGIPRLPLLEPERVASPPLAIALSDIYRYRLDGQERVDGTPCYVVSFDPVDRSRSSFSGRAWIAAGTFAMVKVSAVQTGLRGAIVSSEQTDEFQQDGDSAWLLARSDIRQIYEGAGHRTPIHRVLTIARNEINPEAFDARRAAAYASPSIMLRDTADGYRYLERERGGDGKPASAEPTLAGRADRVRTVAVGVILDPNITRPLPFAGLSYIDFNLFHSGAQLNAFFGGTYGQLAIAVPSIAGSRWQLAGRAFGIASSYNDRAFVEGREIYEANIAQRPAHASVWALRPLTSRLTARAGYEFDYTHFARAGSTANSFTIPASQAAHALRLAVEGQTRGWTGSLWWSGAVRQDWREWGDAAPAGGDAGSHPYDPRQRDYQRMGAVVSRSFVVSPRLVGNVEAAWMTGRDLDRFSRYTFGSFDNRLRGYPSALIRYDRGGVIRGSAAWSAGRLLRVDGFLDTAFVRDPGFGRSPKNYTGIGGAGEFPAPFGTLLAVEWGYGFQGIDSSGNRGTQVVRISGYKMF
jgi:hypothetical protein